MPHERCLLAHQIGVSLQVSLSLVFCHQRVLKDFVDLRGDTGNRCGIRVFSHAEIILEYEGENSEEAKLV